MSQYDGERLEEKLCMLGLQKSESNPDLFILNGCSVTGRASQKVRQTLRSAAKKWPGVKLVLAGCEARLREQRSEETFEADFVLPTYDSLGQIMKMLQVLFKDFEYEAHGENAAHRLTSKTRAFLKVQDGCNQFCSYCIVPYLRGDEWSRPVADAVAEAKRLANEGHRELVLTGIHLGHYKPDLVTLLKELELVKGIERIRLSSIESIEVSESLIDWVASSPKACNHFHLPLQSGCDKILQAMKRPYLTSDYKKVVEEIRSRMPLAAVTTDLIVGFPGETDEDFNKTLYFLEEMQFSRIHIFKFSPREGTPAATMPSQLSNAVKNARSDMVEQVWHRTSRAFASRFTGREIEVLWETADKTGLHGFSREYVPAVLRSDDLTLLNKVSKVRAVSLDENGLLVEPV